MYLVYIVKQIHQLFNEPKKRIFSYIWDRREYVHWLGVNISSKWCLNCFRKTYACRVIFCLPYLRGLLLMLLWFLAFISLVNSFFINLSTLLRVQPTTNRNIVSNIFATWAKEGPDHMVWQVPHQCKPIFILFFIFLSVYCIILLILIHIYKHFILFYFMFIHVSIFLHTY